MHNLIKGAAISIAAIALSITAAGAIEAQATGSVNVRSGPGISYNVLDQLLRGENVNVSRQAGGWCFVRKSGPDGWVSCRYLSTDGYEDDDNDGPNVSIRFGSGPQNRWDDRYHYARYGMWQRGSGFSFSYGN